MCSMVSMTEDSVEYNKRKNNFRKIIKHKKKTNIEQDDEKYYDRHNDHGIPRAILKRVVMEILKNMPSKIEGKLRIDKKAVDILHREVEKYASEIFMVSGSMMGMFNRHTVHPNCFQNAVKLREILIRRLA